MHCLVLQIEIDHATYGDCTHLKNQSRWKPAGLGSHGVVVFDFLVLWLCVVCSTYCMVWCKVPYDTPPLVSGPVNSQIFTKDSVFKKLPENSSFAVGF